MNINSFSIIIPAYNRPTGLAHCLEALCHLDYYRDHFEVIVVDDGSQPPLNHICESFKERLNLVFISQANSGPAAARNKGAEHAGGKYFAFTDDDCMPTLDWLKAMNNHLNNNPSCAVAGRVINVLRENPYATASQVLIDYLYDYYNKNSNGARFFTSSNLGVSSEGFREVGGFDDSFSRAAGEDRDFCARWLYSGKKVIFDSQITVLHAHVLSLRLYLKQHFDYGRGSFHFHEECSRRGQLYFRIEPLTFYRGLFSYRVFKYNVNSKPFLLILLFISQIANILGFFWEKKDRNNK